MLLKKTLFLLCIIANCSFLLAQDNKKTTDKKLKHFTCAPVIGLNYAGLTGSNYGATYQYIFGGQVGFIVNVVDLNRSFSLRAEVNGSMQGAKFPVTFSSGDEATAFFHLTYLNVPIVVRYHSKSGFFGEAGLQPAFLLGARQKIQSYNDNIKNEFNSFDLGIPFGIGYEFKNQIGVGIRCVPGLLNSMNSSIFHRQNLVTSLRITYTI